MVAAVPGEYINHSRSRGNQGIRAQEAKAPECNKKSRSQRVATSQETRVAQDAEEPEPHQGKELQTAACQVLCDSLQVRMPESNYKPRGHKATTSAEA